MRSTRRSRCPRPSGAAAPSRSASMFGITIRAAGSPRSSRIAGIMAAKRTSELIPLCHPLPLTNVEVTLDVGEDVVAIVASAETTAQTGVEMEALTAATVAALTVYDMAKAIDKAMAVVDVRL